VESTQQKRGNFAFDSDERMGQSMKSEKFTVIADVPRAQTRNRGLHSDIDRGAKNAPALPRSRGLQEGLGLASLCLFSAVLGLR